MDDGWDGEFSWPEDYFSYDGEPPQPRTTREQLASTATEKDPDCVDATVVASGLTGDALVLEGCRTVGHIMAKIASLRNAIADCVVIMDPESGRVMAAGEGASAAAHYVIINEEADVAASGLPRDNLLLHAQIDDRATCSRILRAAGGLHGWRRRAAGRILQGAISGRDSKWGTSVKTLMQLGVPAGGAFLTAASLGDTGAVSFLLSAQSALIGVEGETYNADLVEYANSDGDTALLRAADQGHTGTVETLLAAGSNIEHANSRGETGLLRAADQGHTGTVETLLAAGSNIEHANCRGKDDGGLRLRQIYGGPRRRCQIYPRGENGRTNSYRCTALLLAADKGCIDTVEKLLAARANIEHANSCRNTALLEAAGHRYCRADIVEKLLAAGANIEHANLQRDTALLRAAARGHTDMVKKIIEARSNIEHVNSQSDTALLLASAQGHTGTVEKLLAAGSNIEHANLQGDTALLQAIGRRHTVAVERLIAAGSNIEHANSQGNTALLLAAKYGRTYTVEKLLAAGSNIEHANLQGNTALLWAAFHGNTDTVGKLLAAGSNTEHANSHGNTALLLATYAGNCDEVTKLLAAGSDVEHANPAGNTAFDVATFIRRPDVAAKLLAAGASKTRATNSGDLTTLTL